MITQTATINLIPSNVPTVIHVSQYDVGRVISLTILNGVTQFIFGSGQTAIVNGRKPDKTVFTYDASISNNIVSFTTTQQMLAVAGKVLTEIRIQDGNRNDIGTANFILDVENAPIDENAIYSESDIPAIEQAAANIGQAKAAAINAAASASSASASATNAAASEANASNSAAAAAISEANAFSGTPEGYAELASTFNALGLYVDSDGYTCQALFGETKD